MADLPIGTPGARPPSLRSSPAFLFTDIEGRGGGAHAVGRFWRAVRPLRGHPAVGESSRPVLPLLTLEAGPRRGPRARRWELHPEAMPAALACTAQTPRSGLP
jgi:hypothetical protein